MAVVNINLTCELQEAVKVQYIDGVLFSQDNQANKINVTVLDGGEPATISGIVSANIVRSDGGTVAATGGSITGNVASITLPAAAYAVPGVVSIVVKLTASGVITTIAAIVGNMYRSSTDTAIDPGTIIPSIQTLISQINAAVASIPADYSSLWTKLAPAFSTDASYVAGQYVTNNSGLYRFNTTHTGDWSSSDVTAVNLGGEITNLKSALNYTNSSAMPFANDIFNNALDTTERTAITASSTVQDKAIRNIDGAYSEISNQYWFYCEYTVTEKTMYEVYGTCTSQIPIAVFVDNNGNYIGFTPLKTVTGQLRETVIVETPTGCTKMIVNMFDGASPYVNTFKTKVRPDPYIGAINLRDELIWEVGGITNGGNSDSTTRLRTRRIYKFDFPIYLPINLNVSVGVWTYSNYNYSNPSWVGWMSNNTSSYTIPAGTYFRLLTADGAMDKYQYVELYNKDLLTAKNYTKLPLKWRHGVINSTGAIYSSPYPCITDMLVPTEICDYVQRIENTETYIAYYNFVNGEPVFHHRTQITGSNTVHEIDHTYQFFMLHVFANWSTVIDISDCNDILAAYSRLSYADVFNCLLKYGASFGIGIRNSIMMSICHQGYSDSGNANNNVRGGYLRAGERGFTHGECDVKLTSDNKLVCCHDASFVDATSGQTIVIAEKTLAELQACDYYGSTIATLEELIIECKKAGIGLFIDHMHEIIDKVLPVVSELNAWQMCYFLLVSPTEVQTVLSSYSRANIVYLTTINDYDSNVVQYLGTLDIDTYLDIGQYASENLSTIKTIIASLPANVKALIWTVDSIYQINEFLPYVSGWTSNNMSGRDVFNPTYGCGIDGV